MFLTSSFLLFEDAMNNNAIFVLFLTIGFSLALHSSLFHVNNFPNGAFVRKVIRSLIFKAMNRGGDGQRRHSEAAQNTIMARFEPCLDEFFNDVTVSNMF
jgi:hypothetical protein